MGQILFCLHDMTMPKNGDILRVAREGYTHWGIYASAGDWIPGSVIHYSGDGDFKGTVMETPMEKFTQGAKNVEVMTKYLERNFRRCFSGEKTLARARSQLGHGDYDILTNNCEHFAIWCKTGKRESSQTGLLKPFETTCKLIAGSIKIMEEFFGVTR